MNNVSTLDTGIIYSGFMRELFSENEFFDGISKGLSFLSGHIQFDRATVTLSNTSDKSRRNVVQWCQTGVESTEKLLSEINYDEYDPVRFYGPDEILYFDNHSLIVEEFRENLNRLPVNVAVIPLKISGETVGNVIIESVIAPHCLTAAETEILLCLSGVIAGHMKSEYRKPNNSDSSENAKKILGLIETPLYIVNKTYDILYTNISDIPEGQKCHKMIYGSDYPCENCVLVDNMESDFSRTSIRDGYDVNVKNIEWSNDKAYLIIRRQRPDNSSAPEFSMSDDNYSFIFKENCDYLIDVDIENDGYRFTQVNENVSSGISSPTGKYSILLANLMNSYCRGSKDDNILGILPLPSLREEAAKGEHTITGRIRVLASGNRTKWRQISIHIKDEKSAVIVLKDITRKVEEEIESELLKKHLLAAVDAHYPLIITTNLTKNECSLFSNSNYHIDIKKEYTDLDEFLAYFVETLHPEDRESYMRKVNRSRITTALSGESAVDKLYYETRQKGDDGQYRWIYTRIIRIDDENNDVCAVFLIRCIDSEKQKEQILKNALMQSENLSSSKTAFMLRMSDEIRNPVQTIFNQAESAISASIPETMLSSLEKISGTASSMLSMVNNINDMTRLENNEIRILRKDFILSDVVTEVRNIISPRAKIKGIDFRTSESPNNKKCYSGDPERIKQILLNLLTNSVKFTNRGGSITLDVSEAECAGGYSYVNFTVSDTGIGMSKEFMKHLYEPFEKERAITSVTSEAGLGLYITKRLVSLMNGHINVTSEKDRGTEFVVELKLSVKDESTEDSIDFTGKRILVVDDNEMTREMICTLLEMKNATADYAENGRIAVEKYKKASPCYYDAILMDIVIPEFSGYDATKAIRSCDRVDAKSIPIIAISANDSASDISESFAVGMNDHIIKPIEPKKLFSVLSKFLV